MPPSEPTAPVSRRAEPSSPQAPGAAPAPRPFLRESTLYGLISLVALVFVTHVTQFDNRFVTADRDALMYCGFGGRVADLGALWTGAAARDGVPDAGHPLAVILRTVDRQLFGLAPKWHHVHAVAWHALAVLLSAGWIRRAFGDARLAWLAAALFAVLPAHAAAVSILDHRPVVVATAAVCAGLWALTAGRRWLAALLLTAGLLAHGVALALIPFWLVVQWMRGGGGGRRLLRASARDLAWLAGGVVLSAVLRIQALPFSTLPATGDRGGPLAVTGAVLRTLLYQGGQLILPLRLSEVHVDPPAPWPWPAEWLVVPVVGIGGFLLLRRGHDRILAGGALLAVIGLASFAVPFALPQLWSDHLLYLPTLGVALAGARLLQRFILPRRSRWLWIAILAIGLAVLHTWAESHFRDDNATWRRARRVAPDALRTQRGQVALAIGNGELDAARTFVNDLPPDRQRDPVIRGLFAVLMCRGGYSEPAKLIFDAIAPEDHPAPARLHLQAAGCALSAGRFEWAIDAATRAVEIAPWMPDAYAVRGRAHFAIRRFAAAQRDLFRSCELAPDRPDLCRDLVRVRDAIEALRAGRP